MNDTLGRIWVSYQVAQRDGRTLLVDTRACGLWDHLDQYFVPRPGVRMIPRASDSLIGELNQLSCYPPQRQTKVDFLFHEAHLRQGNLGLAAKSGRKLRFLRTAVTTTPRAPFRADPGARPRFVIDAIRRLHPLARPVDDCCLDPRPEQLVIHHTFGGGLDSLHTLQLVTLAEPARRAVLPALAEAGAGYTAIHIRNTDMTTNYRLLLTAQADRLAGHRVLVTGDDRQAIAEAHRVLRRSDVFSLNDVPQTGGLPLHKIGALRSEQERREINQRMLVDLFALAGADQVLLPRRLDGGVSGFGALAQALQQRPELVRDLLAGPPTETHRG